MNKREVIGAAILVLVIAAGIWAYSAYRASPEVAPPPVTGEVSRGEYDARVLADLKKDWPRLEQGPFKHAGESGHWFLDAVEFVGPEKILVHFEDGLNDGYALLNRLGNGTFEVTQRFQNPGEFQGVRAASSYSSTIYQHNPDRGTFTLNPEYKVFEPAGQSSENMEIKVALLNPDGTLPNEVKDGDVSGCDHVVLIERSIPRTTAPLTAALELLLADKAVWSSQEKIYNYISQGNLKLSSVSIQNGIANVYLTGTTPPIAGVCDEPRLFIQVAQTARQFPTVKDVLLYVNGQLNNRPGGGFGPAQ